jgi:hypothetical protein
MIAQVHQVASNLLAQKSVEYAHFLHLAKLISDEQFESIVMGKSIGKFSHSERAYDPAIGILWPNGTSARVLPWRDGGLDVDTMVNLNLTTAAVEWIKSKPAYGAVIQPKGSACWLVCLPNGPTTAPYAPGKLPPDVNTFPAIPLDEEGDRQANGESGAPGHDEPPIPVTATIPDVPPAETKKRVTRRKKSEESIPPNSSVAPEVVDAQPVTSGPPPQDPEPQDYFAGKSLPPLPFD